MYEEMSKGEVIIMGDFNYGDIDWDLRKSGNLGKEFLDLVDDCFLWQHVKVPTRGKNILDLVLSSEENMIEDLEVRGPVANSDHNLITFRLMYKTEEEDKRKINYKYDKADYVAIQEKIRLIKWRERFEGKTVEDMWKIFKREITEIRDSQVPIAKVYKRVYPKWMTGKIKKLIKK